MSCSACMKRSQGRIIPIKPPNKKPDERGAANGKTNTAQEQGSALRQHLRYTGR